MHLSDIHFGQEKGGRLVIHDDVRERLVDDAKEFFEARKNSGGLAEARGVLVTGDIAYAGKRKEYEKAGAWLDRLTNAIGCETTSVQVIPGNHDIDLSRITHATKLMLEHIAKNGDDELDNYLSNETDRELLYARLTEYRDFAEGYQCPLDGGGGHAGEKRHALAPGRDIAFVGLNSALICRGKESEGELLLGGRQRTIEITPGVERIVLMHHPVRWLLDRKDAQNYLTSRARILLTGHEHRPEIVLESAEGGTLLKVEAGAVTPPEATDEFNFTYNIIDFSWAERDDALSATIHPRVWNKQRTRFEPDFKRLRGEDSCTHVLQCPQFQQAPRPKDICDVSEGTDGCGLQTADNTVNSATGTAEAPMEDDELARLRLLFFRELTRGQRLAILAELGALPADLPDFPNMSVERKAFGLVHKNGQIDKLKTALERALKQSGKEGS